MRKIGIGLDFSGVIVDCGKAKSKLAMHLYRQDIPRGIFKRKTILDNRLLTPEQLHDLQHRLYDTREAGYRLKAVTGIYKYLAILQREGHRLKVITSRKEFSLEIAREWMELNCINLPIVGVGPESSKADACKGLDIFVDDDLHRLEELVDIVPNRFLFTWDYNRHIRLEDGIVKRAYSWKDLYSKISDITYGVKSELVNHTNS